MTSEGKPDASGMVWATYLDRGNSLGNGTFVQSISPDAAGNVWAVGITGGIVFPSPTGVSTGPEFVVGMNAAGSALIYQSNDPMGTVAQSVSLDPSGLVHVAGINGFVSTIAPAAAPPMEISYIANAAGGMATARISPDACKVRFRALASVTIRSSFFLSGSTATLIGDSAGLRRRTLRSSPFSSVSSS